MSHNAKVYIAGRGGEKTERAIADLKDITGREVHFTCKIYIRSRQPSRECTCKRFFPPCSIDFSITFSELNHLYAAASVCYNTANGIYAEAVPG